MLNLSETFAKFEGEYGEFHRIDSPASTRPDLCAFMLLDKLLPSNKNIISYAGHDYVALNVAAGDLAAVATEADIATLVRCRMRYNAREDSLEMFV